MKSQATELEKYFQTTYPTENQYLEYIVNRKKNIQLDMDKIYEKYFTEEEIQMVNKKIK